MGCICPPPHADCVCHAPVHARPHAQTSLTDPIDFGPSFDPEDMYSHRHCFPESSGDIQVIPSQDYYGPEHDDPLNGEGGGQIFLQLNAQLGGGGRGQGRHNGGGAGR